MLNKRKTRTEWNAAWWWTLIEHRTEQTSHPRRTWCHCLCLSQQDAQTLSLHFNGHFPGGPGLAGTRMSPFWISLELTKGDAAGGNNCSYNKCKAPVKSSPPINQHPADYRPDALPVTQPTVSEHWREIKALKDKSISRLEINTGRYTCTVFTVTFSRWTWILVSYSLDSLDYSWTVHLLGQAQTIHILLETMWLNVPQMYCEWQWEVCKAQWLPFFTTERSYVTTIPEIRAGV